MLKAASELSGPSTLTRKKPSVNDVFLKQTITNACFASWGLDNVRKVLSGSCKPPVSKDKADYREGREISQSPPIGQVSIEENPAIVTYQRRERIEAY